jgi:hypothetical protein
MVLDARGGVGVNGAGVLTYANLRYGSAGWDVVRRVIEELALPYDPLPTDLGYGNQGRR